MAETNALMIRMKLAGAATVQRGLKATGRAAQGMGQGMGRARASVASLGAALNPVVLGTAAAAAGMLAAKEAFVGTIRATLALAERLDEIGKKAKAIGGVSAESLQEMVGAFELAGIASEQSIKSMQKLNQSTGEAMRGTKTYTDAFKALGLEAGKVARMPLKERMLAIADGMGRMGTQAEKAQVGALLFGRAWKDLVVGMGDKATLESAIKDISRFHVASDEAVRNSEDLQDAILRSNKAWEAMKTEALEPLIPMLTGVSNGFAKIVTDMSEDGEIGQVGINLAQSFEPFFLSVVRITGELRKLFEVYMILGDLTIGAHPLLGEGWDPVEGMKDAAARIGNITEAFEKINKETAEFNDTFETAMEEARKAASIPAEDLTPGGGDLPASIDAIADSYKKVTTQIERFQASQLSLHDQRAAAQEAVIANFEREMEAAETSGKRIDHYATEAAGVAVYQAAVDKKRQQAAMDALAAQLDALNAIYDAKEKAARKSRAAATVDPLADLKKQKEALLADAHAYEESLKTKETLLKDSLKQRNDLIAELKAKGLLAGDLADQLEAQFKAEHDAKMIELEQARADEMQRIRDEEIRKDDQRRAEEAEKLKAYQAAQTQAAVDVLMTVGTVAAQIGSMITSLADENNEEAQRAAKALFLITQAASLGVAIVKTSEAIAIANALPPPGNIPAMISAGAIGAAQIATIVGTTVTGMAHAGLPPGAIQGANEATILMRRDEMILDPVGTRAISRMLDQRSGGGQAVQVHTTLELDGQVLGRTVDDHLVRSSERGLSYQERVRY